MKKTLIYGYGNPGRQDDGLGVFLAERLEEWVEINSLENIEIETNFQLNIEDACTISEYDLVIFADATIREIGDFSLEPLKPSRQVEYTMHAVEPGFVLYLCQELYDKYPETYILSLRGYEFEFGAELTSKAAENLDTAIAWLKGVLDGDNDAVRTLRNSVKRAANQATL